MLLLFAAALPSLIGSGAAPAGCVEAPAPKVNYRPNVATASSSPWIDSNSWRFLRHPDAKFCIEAPGKRSALAAAEAFAYGVTAFLRTGPDGAGPFDAMIGFLKALPPLDLPPLANIGIVDDGAPQTGELLNLMSRRNLLYRIVDKPDPKLDVNVTGKGAADPSRQAYAIRQQLGDGKRLFRIYGTEVVIGRLTGDGMRARLHLLNYAERPVNGVRIRVLGRYRSAEIHIFGIPDAKILDFDAASDATEFTVPKLNEYAVIDLR